MKTKQVAKKLQDMGENEDTILAHINPQEAAMLKANGGSGKVNKKTGLLSFSFGDGVAEGGYGAEGFGGFGGESMGGGREGGIGAAMAEAAGVAADPSSGLGGPGWGGGYGVNLSDYDAAQFGLTKDPVTIGPNIASAWADALAAARAKAATGVNFGLGLFGLPGKGLALSGAGKSLSDSIGYSNAMRDAAIAGGWAPESMPGGATGGNGGTVNGDPAGWITQAAAAAQPGLLTPPTTPAAPASTYARPAFIRKFGQPRGLLGGTQLRGILGG